jgi:ATP-binding protein involved in chromosome partitioning
MASPLTESQVLKALKVVIDPDLNRDIVDLGFVKNVKIDGGQVSFTIELTTPACPVKDKMAAEARQAVSALPGVKDVQIELTASTTGYQQSNNLIPNVRNTIAIASGKGGVGKSTVAANVAIALARSGARVGMMDTDVYGPCIPMLLGGEKLPEMTAQNMIKPPIEHGIKVISMAYFLPRDRAVIWRGPMLHKMIQQFLGDVDWGELDYLVMDLPPGTGDIQLSLCQTIPLTGAAIVSTPQDLALTVASKAIAMFNQMKVPILGLIENMSYYACPKCGHHDNIFGHGGAREASREMGIPFLGEIPLATDIRDRSDAGNPVALGDEQSPYTRAFMDVARALAAQVSIVSQNAAAQVSIEM